jgi:hypothetical protein
MLKLHFCPSLPFTYFPFISGRFVQRSSKSNSKAVGKIVGKVADKFGEFIKDGFKGIVDLVKDEVTGRATGFIMKFVNQFVLDPLLDPIFGPSDDDDTTKAQAFVELSDQSLQQIGALVNSTVQGAFVAEKKAKAAALIETYQSYSRGDKLADYEHSYALLFNMVGTANDVLSYLASEFDHQEQESKVSGCSQPHDSPLSNFIGVSGCSSNQVWQVLTAVKLRMLAKMNQLQALRALDYNSIMTARIAIREAARGALNQVQQWNTTCLPSTDYRTTVKSQLRCIDTVDVPFGARYPIFRHDCVDLYTGQQTLAYGDNKNVTLNGTSVYCQHTDVETGPFGSRVVLSNNCTDSKKGITDWLTINIRAYKYLPRFMAAHYHEFLGDNIDNFVASLQALISVNVNEPINYNPAEGNYTIVSVSTGNAMTYGSLGPQAL